MNIENNEWMLLNSIIYKFNSTEELTKARKTFLDFLQFIIPYDQALFFLSEEKGGSMIGDPIGVNIDNEKVKEYLNNWVKTDNLVWMSVLAKGMVYIESELLNEEIREKEAIQHCYVPENSFFSMGAFFVCNNEFLGSVHLFRKKEREDFTSKDKFILEALKDHVELRLYREKKRSNIYNHEVDGLMDVHYYSKSFSLTIKELEIIQLFIKEYTDNDICEMLYISPSTFKKHISSIYKKLDVKNRKELLVKVVMNRT